MEVWKSVSTWELLQRVDASFFTLLFNQLVRNHSCFLLFFFLHKITSPELIFPEFFQAMYLVHLPQSHSPEGDWDRDWAIWPLMSSREKLRLNFFWCFNSSFLPPLLAWTYGCLEEVWRQHLLSQQGRWQCVMGDSGMRIPSSCVRGWGAKRQMKPPSKSLLVTYPLHLESPWQSTDGSLLSVFFF